MFKFNPITGQIDLVRSISDNPTSNTAEESASTVATTALADEIAAETTARQDDINILVDEINGILNEKKEYKVFLSQIGTAAPTAVVLKDTVTGLAWARTDVGTYTLTKVGAFTVDKTVPEKDIYTDQAGNLLKINRTSADVMTLLTYAADILADGVLSGQYFQLEIYS